MTSQLQHVLLTRPGQVGFQYAVQNDFEEEIVRLTGAQLQATPTRQLPSAIARRLQHGTRYGFLRSYIPRKTYDLRADVLWVPLMGPENFELDLYKHWSQTSGYKILYLFDTFEYQLQSLRRVLNAAHWDLA